MSTENRINKALRKATKIRLDKESKFILFSDCHRGDNSFSDDFARNRNIYKHAINHYYEEGFSYIELGDGDELWENSDFKNIFKANKHIYLGLKKFFDKGRLHFIWGNHDMDYKKQRHIRKNLYYYIDDVDQTKRELFKGVTFSESILLEDQSTKKSIFLLHGHQADWFNYNFWKLSRFLVKILWRPLQIIGVSDPTSPAQNFKGHIRIERKIEHWIQNNNNQMVVIGHTHRPRFPKPKKTPFFNAGSCVHPRAITGLEIQNNEITLIKWHIISKKNGSLQIVRTILEGPENLTLYMN